MTSCANCSRGVVVKVSVGQSNLHAYTGKTQDCVTPHCSLDCYNEAALTQISVLSTLSPQHTRINLPARKELEEVATQKRRNTPKETVAGTGGR